MESEIQKGMEKMTEQTEDRTAPATKEWKDDWLLTDEEMEEYSQRVDSHGADAVHMDQVESYIKKLHEFDKDLEQLTAHAKSQIEAAKTWLEEVTEQNQAKREWYEKQIRNFLIQQGRKSMTLINGKVGIKAGRERVEVLNVDDFMAWAKREGKESLVRTNVTESVDKIATMENYKLSGEIPEGLDIVKSDPSFSVKYSERLEGEDDTDR
jgi:phage host-nuclease inhibitor protein Gam